MIDPKLLKENLSVISLNLKNKNYTLDKDEFLKVDSDRKELILENESLTVSYTHLTLPTT